MPPLNDIITPNGVYLNVTCSFPPRTADTQLPGGAALKWVAEKAVESYYGQLDFMREQAATASASRRAWLEAAYKQEQS